MKVNNHWQNTVKLNLTTLTLRPVCFVNKKIANHHNMGKVNYSKIKFTHSFLLLKPFFHIFNIFPCFSFCFLCKSCMTYKTKQIFFFFYVLIVTTIHHITTLSIYYFLYLMCPLLRGIDFTLNLCVNQYPPGWVYVWPGLLCVCPALRAYKHFDTNYHFKSINRVIPCLSLPLTSNCSGISTQRQRFLFSVCLCPSCVSQSHLEFKHRVCYVRRNGKGSLPNRLLD